MNLKIKIFDYIRTHPHCALCDIKRALKLYPQKIDYHLQTLTKKGVIIRNGGYCVQPFIEDDKIEEMIGFLFAGLLKQKGIQNNIDNDTEIIHNSIQIMLESFSQSVKKIIK